MKLDRYDIAILEGLQRNARISLQALGNEVGLTASPCWTRIRRMEAAGVIEGYTVRLNPEALGLADTVIVHVTLESHSDEALTDFGRALAAIPEVLEAFLVSGEYDYYIRIAVSDSSREPIHPRQARSDDVTGRGLQIVEAVSTRWGVDESTRGKTVWCTIGR